MGSALPAASWKYRSLNEAGDPNWVSGMDTFVHVFAVTVKIYMALVLRFAVMDKRWPPELPPLM